jgi:hypothetical protein
LDEFRAKAQEKAEANVPRASTMTGKSTEVTPMASASSSWSKKKNWRFSGSLSGVKLFLCSKQSLEFMPEVSTGDIESY